MGLDFVAVDFETANSDPTSACAIGLAVVRSGCLTESTSYLIRPFSPKFTFSYLHGITWDDVRDAPTFCELWESVRVRLSSDILVAHNAVFDKSVLLACLRYYDIQYQMNTFVCSMQLAKKAFGFRRLKLDHVCKQLKINLRHHDAGSDAQAAAQIVIRAAPRLKADAASQLLRFCQT